LATISVDGEAICVAHLSDGSMLDISGVAGSVQALIEGGKPALDATRTLLAEAEDGQHPQSVIRQGARLMAPIPRPLKNVFCVGRNYAEHIAEGDRAQNQKVGVSEHPVFFTKPPTAVVAPDGDVLIFPEVSTSIDYEVELTVVIGRRGRNISKADAMDHVFGYTILNDITARDIQRRHGGQYFRGKGLDGSCPIGPVIVTADEIDDPHALAIGLSVNGERRQDGNTKDMIFDIPTLIASLSAGLTLEPGDMIATGTPSGVGYAMDPPKFLRDGDTVVCEISGIGTLSNTVRSV
jgi:2-keto-4-pentenoate hydratase/2-oxohepta-3-ene-1,7-dioic acid hydratase in catechol pathway